MQLAVLVNGLLIVVLVECQFVLALCGCDLLEHQIENNDKVVCNNNEVMSI